MKNLILALVAISSIALGIWLGTQSGNKSSDSFAGYPDLGGEFVLQSDKGEVKLSDFKGKVVTLYFGYTHCPDVCITALSKMAAALKTLPKEQREQIQPIFITFDPERDDAKTVAEYARYFDKSFIGLTGTPAQIAEIAKRYFIIYEKVPIEGSAVDYAMDHSSQIFITNKKGIIQTIVHHADTTEALAKYLEEATK